MSRKRANANPRFESRRLRTALLAFTIAAGPAGCGRAPTLDPPVVHYGETICAHCNMIVSEERFATASLADTPEDAAEPFVFDDVSCQFAFESAHPEVVVRMRFVHDARTGDWIDAASARFVKSDDIRSPMGGGVLAAGNVAFADSLGAAHAGEVVTFEGLRVLFEKGS